MSHRIAPLLLVLLLISASTSHARTHRRHHIQGGGSTRTSKAARVSNASAGDEGGALSSDRGISQVESAAIGVLVDEIAHSRGATGTVAVVSPQHRLSADYYRVHARQTGTTKKTGTATQVVFSSQPSR